MFREGFYKGSSKGALTGARYSFGVPVLRLFSCPLIADFVFFKLLIGLTAVRTCHDWSSR